MGNTWTSNGTILLNQQKLLWSLLVDSFANTCCTWLLDISEYIFQGAANLFCLVRPLFIRQLWQLWEYCPTLTICQSPVDSVSLCRPSSGVCPPLALTALLSTQREGFGSRACLSQKAGSCYARTLFQRIHLINTSSGWFMTDTPGCLTSAYSCLRR